MKVGELIQLLQAFDFEMKVLMTRSDTGLEDVVACYEDLVCQGRLPGMTNSMSTFCQRAQTQALPRK